MGILNITPDSFYKNSSCMDVHSLKKKIKRVINSDITDIGAESTRPKSEPLLESEELNRLDLIFDNLDLLKDKVLSIDTYKPMVAKKAILNGFAIINDIYGGINEEMLSISAEFDKKIILMHIQGDPKTMQEDICYDNIIDDIMHYFEKRIDRAVKLGVKSSNIIIDPGIGFGKSLSDNYKIINNISKFKSIGFDVMIGLSRKSFLSINNDSPSDRMISTIGASTISVLNGADIIRVHDVNEHILLNKIINKFKINK